MSKKGIKLLIIAAAVIVLLAVIILAVKPAGMFGIKKVTIEVRKNETAKEYVVKTTRDNLADVLTDNDIVEGEDGEYGLYILSANGYTADSSKEEWWGLYKSGEMLMTGANDTPVENGDHFEVVLETGYDF